MDWFQFCESLGQPGACRQLRCTASARELPRRTDALSRTRDWTGIRVGLGQYFDAAWTGRSARSTRAHHRKLPRHSRPGVIGQKNWKREVAYAVTQLRKSFVADYVVLGGGLVHRFGRFPQGTKRGQNENALLGGIRLWEIKK